MLVYRTLYHDLIYANTRANSLPKTPRTRSGLSCTQVKMIAALIANAIFSLIWYCRAHLVSMHYPKWTFRDVPSPHTS
jgi:hypothetical protein